MIAAFGKNSSDPLVLLREGKFKKALKILERMEKRNALDFNMRMRLAEAYEGAGRPADAAAVYKAEAESRFAGGDRAIGITLLKKALKVQPSDEDLVKRLEELESSDNNLHGGASFSFDIGADETGSFDADALSKVSEPGQETANAGNEAEESDLGEANKEIATAPEELGVEAGDVINPKEESEAGKSEENAAPDLNEEEAALPNEEITEEIREENDEDEGKAGEVVGGPLDPSVTSAEEEFEKGSTLGGIESKGLALLAGLFPSLDTGELDFIQEMVEKRELSADDILLKEGDEGDSFYIVSKGRFAVYGTFEGNEMQLAELAPGSVIGEVSFLRRVPRTATVTAIEDSEVLELSPSKLSRIDSDDNAFKKRLETILNERIDMTIAMLKEKRGEEDVET